MLVFSIQCSLVLNFQYWMKIYIFSSVWGRIASNENNSRTFRESLLILVWGCSQSHRAYVTIGSTPPSTVDSIILLELFFLAWWVFCWPRNPFIQDTHNWGPNLPFPTLMKYLFNDNLIFRDKLGMTIRDSARGAHLGQKPQGNYFLCQQTFTLWFYVFKGGN